MLTKKITTLVVLVAGLVGIVSLRTGVAYRVLGTMAHSEKLSSLQSASVEQVGQTLFSFLHHKPNAAIETTAIVEYTNNERIAAGVTPLSINEKLSRSAQAKVEDMAQQQYFEHVSPSGNAVSDFGDRSGYTYVIMGENLAMGDFENAAEVVHAWMESPGHRENILNEQYQEIGIASKMIVYKGQDVWMVVQHFGTPRTACPTVDYDLKKTIASINESLEQQQRQISEKRIELTKKEGTEEYDALVSKFNTLVQNYNALLSKVQKQTTNFNRQVTSFNHCIASYESSSSDKSE